MEGLRSYRRAEALDAARAKQTALDLARRLPALVVAAKQMAASVLHGVHGRRRAGSGETFWQFRPFFSGEPAQRIDWRRSARDDRLYVREREWEAAHTLWLWMDQSPSMNFASDEAIQSKGDRALILGLATADLLVRGGERVGLMGLSRPLADRAIIDRFAEILLGKAKGLAAHAQKLDQDNLPPPENLGPASRAILISDFLVDPLLFAERLKMFSAQGATGQLLMIADPIEETFPYRGHVEFLDTDSPATLRSGRAESWRTDYERKLAVHRGKIAEIARLNGFSLLLHRTDRPASQALLALRGHLEAGAAA